MDIFFQRYKKFSIRIEILKLKFFGFMIFFLTLFCINLCYKKQFRYKKKPVAKHKSFTAGNVNCQLSIITVQRFVLQNLPVLHLSAYYWQVKPNQLTDEPVCFQKQKFYKQLFSFQLIHQFVLSFQ